MGYVALYRKYRPLTFSDVYGRDVIVEVLKNSIINNRISHAYVFSGPRGTGKTTLARIFARAVNCTNFHGEVCGECDSCIALKNNDTDIIEIDAASNNGVDEIREIRNNVKLMPSVGKYKVYIIDEVHMLSTGAFNALLKTLEEPPAHVIFVLATTELNKIPLTILSRCLKFDFNKFTDSKIVERLKYICDSESFSVSDDILSVIAQLSDGGMRDAINMLDQIISLGIDEVNVDDIYRISGAVSSTDAYNLIYYARKYDIEKALSLINDLFDNGKNFVSVVNKMLIVLRDYKLNRISKDYFESNYSLKLSELDLTTDNCNKMIDILTKLLSQLSSSSNQKNLFEIYYLMLVEIFDSVVGKNTIEPLSEPITVKEVNPIDDMLDEDEFDYKKLMNIRINNVLACATKQELRDAASKVEEINEYLTNKKYMNYATLIINSKLVAVGKNRLLFCVNDDTELLTFYKNLDSIQNLLRKVYGEDCIPAAVTSNVWEVKKKEFVINVKNGVKYSIEHEDFNIKKSSVKKSKVESSAMEVFGEDSIDVC